MDEGTLNTLNILVGNLGFPVVIALYLLIRFENKISELTEVVEKLHNLLEKK
jgi:Trk-type K+ transport system membrane component